MDKNRNISIASKNGYSLAKVKKAKEYLDEIGSNRSNFDFATMTSMEHTNFQVDASVSHQSITMVCRISISSVN